MKKLFCVLLTLGILLTSSFTAFAVTKGDVNSDGNVNSSDALLILKSSVGMNPANFNASLADMNEDGNINSSDALIVLKISVGLINPDEEKEDPLKFNKSQLVEYYNSCLKKSYSYEINATKVEQVDMKVSGVDFGGSTAINTDSLVNSIIANNTKNNGVVQTKSFMNGKAADDNSPVEKFVAPANLYDEAVKTINIHKNGTGYQIIVTLKAESCPHNETAEYNASCSWPLDINAIDFGQAITIQECTFNYPGTKLAANIDSEGRVTTLKTEMPLTVTNATAKALGINITVGSIEGKWTCHNTMAFAESPDTGNSGSSDAAGNAGAQQPAQLTKADVIKLFNAETAKAAKGSYKLTRTGKFIKPIDVGSLTGALNTIITGVDENASLDSVVGGFLGIKKDPIKGDVKNGKGEGFDAKYMIKGMALTDADVVDFAVSGNTYKIKVKDCVTPNASSAIAHATNDYITFAEVNKSISDSVGNAIKVVEGESDAKYSNIIFTATIVDGKMTALEYSYTLDANLKIKLAIPIATGTCQVAIYGKYTDVEY